MDIEKKVQETIKKYNLINKDDLVVVALSGGKDSTSILYILKKLGYNVHGLMIELHLGEWSKTHKKNMTLFCEKYNIPFTVVDLKEEIGQGICYIKTILKRKKNLTGCSVCGTIKKWMINKHAKKLGADKLVTGHNLDDETQNVLMSFLKGNINLSINSSPIAGTIKIEGFIPRVKPLFFIPESEIKKYALKKRFEILYDKCPCSFGTYRTETRIFTKSLTNSEKLKIVENFQEKILPQLRKEEVIEIKLCKKCGEPCRRELCSFCNVTSDI
jgi:uncharacterized protein (TIGR00269 family)